MAAITTAPSEIVEGSMWVFEEGKGCRDRIEPFEHAWKATEFLPGRMERSRVVRTERRALGLFKYGW